MGEVLLINGRGQTKQKKKERIKGGRELVLTAILPFIYRITRPIRIRVRRFLLLGRESSAQRAEEVEVQTGLYSSISPSINQMPPPKPRWR